MNEYYITVSTGICGYNFELMEEAETEEKS